MPIKSQIRPSALFTPLVGLPEVSSTALRRDIGGVVQLMEKGDLCVLVSHKKPKGVLVPIEKYLELVAAKPANNSMKVLTEMYDQMFASQDTPAARVAAKAAFDSGTEAFQRPLA